MSIWLTFNRQIAGGRNIFQGHVPERKPLARWTWRRLQPSRAERMGLLIQPKNEARLKPQNKDVGESWYLITLFSAVQIEFPGQKNITPQKQRHGKQRLAACCYGKCKAPKHEALKHFPQSPPSHKTRQGWPPCVRPDPLLQFWRCCSPLLNRTLFAVKNFSR